MSVVQNLCALALRQVVSAASQAAGLDGEAIVGALEQHLTDHGGRLTRALQNANDRAWRALEIALAGESFWERVRTACAGAEDRAFREHVRAFLDAAGTAQQQLQEKFRRECLHELRAARKAGLLSAGHLDVDGLASQAAVMARYADPQALLDADKEAVREMAVALRRSGYVRLGDLLAIQAPQGQTLLTAAVRYFFRREVEADAELFRGMAWIKLECLDAVQQAGFAGLEKALADRVGRMEDLLSDVRGAVEATHGKVLDVLEEQRRHAGRFDELYTQVLVLHGRFDLLARDLRAADSLSIRTDAERQLVKALVARFRALTVEQRRDMPALLNALGKLQVLSGDFEEAQRDFGEVAATVADPAALAEAHYNAYRAALGRRDWAPAMRELLEAVKLDGKRFAPFPVGKYQPKRILGAGGFGVAFLCRHKDLSADVVVKALHREDLDRGVDEVLAEARLLHRLDHPNVVRLLDCGYTLPAAKARPYFVMQYIPGQTLEEYVRQRPLTAAECVTVARRMAEGLDAAHRQGGVLHRDVKPANVLVRRSAAAGWRVTLIDFGLALRTQTMAETAAAASTGRRGLGGLAGTVEYAAPEQMGRAPGVPVGPYSDVYGLGKTCCYALFRTTQPLPKHWGSIPEPLARLLGDCLEEDPRHRPPDCAAVLARLVGLEASGYGESGDANAAGSNVYVEVNPIPVAAVVSAEAKAPLYTDLEVVEAQPAARTPLQIIHLRSLLTQLQAAHAAIRAARRWEHLAWLSVALGLPAGLLGLAGGNILIYAVSSNWPQWGLLMVTCCFLLGSLLPGVALFVGRFTRAAAARRSVEAVAAALQEHYPQEVMAWGGGAVLRDDAVVRALFPQRE